MSMKNKIFTSITMIFALAMIVGAQSFERQWDMSKATSATPAFFEGFNTRGIAATPDYLFVASRSMQISTEGKAVFYLDAKTGVIGGQMDVSIITKGQLAVNDLEVSDDGQILVSNLALPPQADPWRSWQFKIYKWTDKSAVPTVYIDYANPNSLRLGDMITVKGDLTKNAVIYASVHQTPKVVRWEVVNGVLNTIPEIIELKGIVEANSALGFPKVIPAGVTKNDPFYYNATATPLRKFSADGATIMEQIVPANFLASNGVEGRDNSITHFTVDGQQYIATLGIQGAAAASPAEVKAINVTNGLNTAMNPFHSQSLGTTPNNAQLNGDITSTVIDGQVWVFLLYGNEGYAAFKYKAPVPPQPEVVVPVTANGWRRGSNALLDSIDGRLSRPDWLNGNSRAVAVGNGHIYVVNCAENGAGEIRVLDATNGSYLNKMLNVGLLNANPTPGNKIRIADVEVDDAGHILACNMRMGEDFKIYAWDTEESEPYVLAKAGPFPFAEENDVQAIWQQTAYYFDVKGDIKGDAVIIAARSNMPTTLRWVITGGVVQNGGIPTVTKNQHASFGPYAAAALESANPDSPIWISANTLHATRFLADGTFKGTIPAEVAVNPNGFNQELTRSIKYLEWDGKKYLFEFAWSWSSRQCLIDVSAEDLSTLTTVDRIMVGANLGQVANALIWGDVDYFIGVDGALNLVTLESKNGIMLTRFPGTTSTKDLKKNELLIYPNITKDFLNIKHSEGVSKVEIINMAGVVVKSIDNLEQERVDVSMLNSGIYFVKVVTKEKTTAVSKFVVL